MKKFLLVVPMVALLAAGCNASQQASVQTPSVSQNTQSNQPVSQQIPTNSASNTAVTNLTNDQIFQEAAAQLGLKRSDLASFYIYGQDRVQYHGNTPETNGLVFAYKLSGKWYAAGSIAQDVLGCTEYKNIPQQYLPPCYDPVAKQDKYVDPKTGQSTNYPLSQRTVYIGN